MQYIYVIRHGETDANLQGMINDKNVIIPINKTGKQQAVKTGKYLKKYICQNKSKCVIYSSPSTRAVQTANIIGKELGISNIIQDERMVEADYGMISGAKPGDRLFDEDEKMINEYKKANPEPISFALNLKKIDTKWAKHFKAETIDTRVKRIKSFFNSLPKNKKHIIIVTHSNVQKTTLHALFNIPPNGVMGDTSNGRNCTINCIMRKNKEFQLLTLPNTVHLGLKL